MRHSNSILLRMGNRVLISLFLFQYLFRVPWRFSPINLDILLVLFSLLYLISKYKRIRDLGLSLLCLRLTALTILASFHALIMFVGANGSLGIVYSSSMLLIKGLTFPVALTLYLWDNTEKPVRCLFDCLTWVAIAQGLAALVCIVSPNIRYFFNNQLLNLSSAKAMVHEYLYFRGNGFGQGYLFTLPIVQALLLGIALLNSILSRRIIGLCVCLPLVMISIVSNARIGLVFLFLLLIPFLMYAFITNGRSRLMLGIIAIFVIGMFLLIERTTWFSEHSGWVVSILPSSMIQDPYAHGAESTLDTLRDMMSLPSLQNIFFGTGEDAFEFVEDLGRSSDIGYVIQLYAGGLMLFIPLLLIYYLPFRDAFKYFGIIEVRLFLTGLFIAVLVVNIKGNILMAYNFFGVYVIFCMNLIIYGKRLRRLV